MKVSLKKLKDCRVKMVVEVDPETVENRLREVLNDFQKNARLPGFREGKAPIEMVEKRYAKEAEEETLKSLIPEIYHQSVQNEKVHPVSLPKISDIQFARGKKLSFSAEFDESPQVAVKNYKGIKLRREPADISPEDVEMGLSSLLESRAEFIPLTESRAVQQGDFVVTDIEIWENGNYVPGRQGALLHVQPNPEDDFYEKVTGALPEQVREVTREPNEAEKKEGVTGRKPHTRVTIKGIQEKKLPGLDDEFAKSFGKETVDELREAVRKDLASHKHSQSIEKMKAELFAKLLSTASFPVPESFVEKQKEHLIEQARRQYLRAGVPEGRFNENKEAIEKEASVKAAEQVKLYFILQKVSELEGIEVDEIELDQRLNKLVAESRRTLEEVRRVFEEDMRESMRETKTIDFLIANAQFEEIKK